MRRSTIGWLGALVCVASANCGSDGAELSLIARGDEVRLLATADDCPNGWGEADFDDGAWQRARLPIAGVSGSGVCLRKEFDVGSSLSQYRWLTIRLSGRSRAQLNSGKPQASATYAAGLDWSTDDDDRGLAPAPTAAPASREYRLDLRLFPSLLQAQRNVFALQVPATPHAVSIEALLEKDDGSGSDFVNVVKGPYQVRPAPGSMRISWESDRSAPSWVVVDGQQYDGGWAMHHEVQIDGLVSGRVYSFYVGTAEASALPPECRIQPLTAARLEPELLSDDEFWKYVQRRDACKRVAQAIRSEPRDLHAPPATSGHVRLAVLGDTRADATLDHGLFDLAAGESPNLIVHTGDLVATGSESDWQAFFDSTNALLARAPIAPVPGERDNQPWGDRFAQLFGPATLGSLGRAYALDFGPVHLALLDSTANLADEANWLEADLSAAELRGARRLFVVLHWGPWSAGPSGGNHAALESIAPVLGRHHVDAVLSGHDNIYEHGIANGQHYFVTGGAGPLLGRAGTSANTVLSSAVPHYLVIDVEGDTATVRAKDNNGTVFDEVALAP